MSIAKQVRQMEERDVDQVVEIEKQCFSQPWSRQGFLDALHNTDTIFLVLEEGQEIVGYIGMYVSFEEGEITNVAVKPSKRGLGYGKQLVQDSQKEAVNKGVNRAVLEVRVSNAGAIHVYEACGFTTIGVRKGFYDFPKEDAYIMDWTV